jgi:hypothetical protein
MPVCAEKATEKLACLEMFSATMAEDILSISRPPYSSGISIAVRPRSAASFNRRRVTEKSLASIWSEAGMISLMAKFAVVSAICLCSSVKSSGKKQSAAPGSVMRKLPPGTRFVSAIGAVMVAMVLPRNVPKFVCRKSISSLKLRQPRKFQQRPCLHQHTSSRCRTLLCAGASRAEALRSIWLRCSRAGGQGRWLLR